MNEPKNNNQWKLPPPPTLNFWFHSTYLHTVSLEKGFFCTVKVCLIVLQNSFWDRQFVILLKKDKGRIVSTLHVLTTFHFEKNLQKHMNWNYKKAEKVLFFFKIKNSDLCSKIWLIFSTEKIWLFYAWIPKWRFVCAMNCPTTTSRLTFKKCAICKVTI